MFFFKTIAIFYGLLDRGDIVEVQAICFCNCACSISKIFHLKQNMNRNSFYKMFPRKNYIFKIIQNQFCCYKLQKYHIIYWKCIHFILPTFKPVSTSPFRHILRSFFHHSSSFHNNLSSDTGIN